MDNWLWLVSNVVLGGAVGYAVVALCICGPELLSDSSERRKQERARLRLIEREHKMWLAGVEQRKQSFMNRIDELDSHWEF